MLPTPIKDKRTTGAKAPLHNKLGDQRSISLRTAGGGFGSLRESTEKDELERYAAPANHQWSDITSNACVDQACSPRALAKLILAFTASLDVFSAFIPSRSPLLHAEALLMGNRYVLGHV
eukprot:1159361-Pelagomonas_calceolata.AAC.1